MFAFRNIIHFKNLVQLCHATFVAEASYLEDKVDILVSEQ